MEFEERFFRGYQVSVERLEAFGFKDGLYRTEITDGLLLEVLYDGNFRVSVTDGDEEFLNYRYRDPGAYGSRVLSAVEEVLGSIRDLCCERLTFVSSQANRLDRYLKEVYGAGDHPFKDDDYTMVYRVADGVKWYGLLMRIEYRKLGIDRDGLVDVINLKADKSKLKEFLKKDGVCEAYHMNKQNWISVLLDDRLRDLEVILLVNESYDLVSASKKFVPFKRF